MTRTEKKPVARPEIDRELVRKVQARLEKEHKRAVSISGACEYALHHTLMHLKLKQNSND